MQRPHSKKPPGRSVSNLKLYVLLPGPTLGILLKTTREARAGGVGEEYIAAQEARKEPPAGVLAPPPPRRPRGDSWLPASGTRNRRLNPGSSAWLSGSGGDTEDPGEGLLIAGSAGGGENGSDPLGGKNKAVKALAPECISGV